MTTRYVGPGGNNGNNGLTWATRKLTLNGVEDTPIVAGDTVYVGAGTYRELLTCDVDGTAGNLISYIGDYTGANTDGVGGVVRITGSDNDIANARTYCTSAGTKNFRVFKGLRLDMANNGILVQGTDCQILDCAFSHFLNNGAVVNLSGAGQARVTVSNCLFFNVGRNILSVYMNHSSALDDTAHVISNCIFVGMPDGAAVYSSYVSGATIKNCTFVGVDQGVQLVHALTAGKTITVNNCIFSSCDTALNGIATGDITEDYNSFFNCATNRANTNTGANSNLYPPLFDTRWFFQALYGGAGPNNAAQVITPFDLASYSKLIDVAGTSPTATDLRGTGTIGAQREWGALEYDATLKVKSAAGGLLINPGLSGGLR